MKKFILGIVSVLAVVCIAQVLTTNAAASPPALGGTGTVQVPTAGQVLIGNGSSSYTPALLTPGTDIVITTASGSVTIAVQASQFLPSSTVYVATVNGQSGAVTITSSTLGVATNTVSLFNGNNFTTTTIQSVLNALSASGLASYNPATGAFSVSSSSLNLGSASQRAISDFLASSTVYVSTVNGQSGAVTITSVATTTINNMQATVFHVIGDGTTVTSSVSGATTTFSILTTGNWVGMWQGVNSTTFYLASNPNNYISSSTGNSLYYPLNSNPAGYATSTLSTSTTNTFTVPQNFTGVSNNGNVTSTSFVASSTGAQSYIASLNGIYNFPQVGMLALGNCPAAPGVTDAGTCVNDMYALNGSSTPISVPPGVYTYANPIQATSSQALVLVCPAGAATIFNYTGTATSSPAIWIDTTSFGSSYDHLPGSEVDNCVFAGQSATTTPATAITGIKVGGPLVTPHVRLNNVTIRSFGIGLNLASNTYDFESTNIVETNDGETLLVNSASNSGEGIKFYNPWWADPGNASSSNCLVLATSSVASFEVFGGSYDACGWTILAGNVNIALYGMHSEDTGSATYGPYFRISQTNDSVSTVLVSGGTFWLDATSNTSTALINSGSNLTASGVTIDRSTGAQLSSFITNTNGSANANLSVCNTIVANTAVSKLFSNATGVGIPQNGCLTSYKNSYPSGWYVSSANSAYNLSAGNGNMISAQFPNGASAGLGGVIDLGGSGSGTTAPTGSSTVDVDGSLSVRTSINAASTTVTGPESLQNGFTSYIFTGASNATDTLPLISLTTFRLYFFRNRGTATLSIGASSTDSIAKLGNTTSTTYALLPGSSTEILNDGTFWVQLFAQ
jgi:hypothetical protein